MRTMTECKGNFIRKHNWHHVLRNLESNLKEKLIQSIKKDYIEDLEEII